MVHHVPFKLLASRRVKYRFLFFLATLQTIVFASLALRAMVDVHPFVRIAGGAFAIIGGTAIWYHYRHSLKHTPPVDNKKPKLRLVKK